MMVGPILITDVADHVVLQGDMSPSTPGDSCMASCFEVCSIPAAVKHVLVIAARMLGRV